MRSLHADVTAAIASAELAVCHLYTLTVGGTTYRLCDLDRAVSSGGNAYSPGTLDGANIAHDQDGLSLSATLNVADLDDAWIDRFQTSGAVGHAVTIDYAFLNTTTWALLGTAVPVFIGQTTAVSRDSDGQTVISCKSYDDRLNKEFPITKYLPTCQYRRFKGNECQYTGGTATCDRTFATCNAGGGINNGKHFGGFRWCIVPGEAEDFGGIPWNPGNPGDYLGDPKPTGNSGLAHPIRRA
jgi:phage-related protein